MTIRITGMNSGLDTESIIRELTKVEKDKVTKVKNEQKRLEMKQDKWKDLNKKVVNFYNKSLSNLRFDGSYVKKNTSINKADVASVTGSASAMNGTQTLKVKSLASAAYMTGAKVETQSGKKVRLKASEAEQEAATTMEDLGVVGKQKLTFKFGDGSDKMEIEVNGSDNLSDVISRINSGASEKGFKVQANFDEKQGRLYLSSKTTGAAGSFSIDTSGSDYNTLKGLGLLSGNELTSRSGATLSNKAGSSSLTSAAPAYKLLGNTAFEGTKKIAFEFQSGKNADGSAQMSKTYVEISASDTLETIAQKFNEAAVAKANEDGNATYAGMDLGFSYDAANQKFSVRDGSFAILTDDGNGVNTDTDMAYAMGLTESADSVTSVLTADTTNVGQYKAGTDATIVLNDVEYTSDSNQFEINGLTINAKGEGDAVITTQDDNSGIYDMIKGFVSEYNDLIKEITTLYNGEKNKDFDFLTSEQKEEMTDDEIADWNKKIDESIMARDDTLGKLMRNMKNIMLSTFEMTGKDGNKMNVSLSTFGISTLSYNQAEKNERGMYHIDGDEDDEYTNSKDDKLKGLIQSDPNLVSEFFKSLSKSLYSKLGDMMKSTDFSSSFTLYDDKLMKKNYDEYKTKIKKAEDQLALREDAYYKQYAQLEKAMGQINSQQSALGGMMG